MNNLNQEQGSEAWLKERMLRLGGSEIAAVLGISPWMTRYKLWSIKTGLIEQEDISGKPHVIRGILSEPVAREKFNRLSGLNFVPKVWPVIDGCLGASDDGYCEEINEILEIKAMGAQAHEDVKSCIIPEYYRAQCVWNMGISGAAKCNFISVRPENDYELATLSIPADPAAFSEMKLQAKNFWHLVETKTAPELVDADIVDLSWDVNFDQIAREYVLYNGQLKSLEEKVEALKSKLIANTGGHPSVKCSSLRLTRFTRKGPIAYDKIEALKGLDLEPYRKASSISFKITVT